MGNEIKYRITGHETFTFRYTWLPKAVKCVTSNPQLFANEQDAMVVLGVGKNMVRSIKFWAQAVGVIQNSKQHDTEVTPFGRQLLGPDGQDPFLEDIRTLWLLHWRIATNVQSPLLAWDYLLNRWHDPELVQSRVVKALLDEAVKGEGRMSPITVEKHFETFLHTYLPTRGRKGEVQEDNLDCPLVELELLRKVGERENDEGGGRREPIYAFRREDKPDVSAELFAYCLEDFWQQRHSQEETLTLHQVAYGQGSPGQVFKLPEDVVRSRTDQLHQQTDGRFTLVESSNLQQLRRDGKKQRSLPLRSIYEGVYA